MAWSIPTAAVTHPRTFREMVQWHKTQTKSNRLGGLLRNRLVLGAETNLVTHYQAHAHGIWGKPIVVEETACKTMDSQRKKVAKGFARLLFSIIRHTWLSQVQDYVGQRNETSPLCRLQQHFSRGGIILEIIVNGQINPISCICYVGVSQYTVLISRMI
jgi:hypothetical protein